MSYGNLYAREVLGLGILHLLTPYHHLLTRAPTVLPCSLALRFQCCQPQSRRLYIRPWARGMMTCRPCG